MQTYATPATGEVTLGPYTVDGYDEESRTVYEFYGCYWHGCPDCYPNLATEMHPHQVQKTYQDLYEETGRRAKALEDQGYAVVSIWEHEFDRLVQQNPTLQQFIQDLDI
jgi:G:T-mismatch repair DNA endonuclease (very short patch repair protein)